MHKMAQEIADSSDTSSDEPIDIMTLAHMEQNSSDEADCAQK